MATDLPRPRAWKTLGHLGCWLAAVALAIGIAACGSSSSAGLRGLGDGGRVVGSGGSPGSEAGSGTGGASGAAADAGLGGAGAGACVTSGDCGASADCLRGVCIPVTTCKNSFDCGADVCNSATHRCVECATAGDCNPGEECLGDKCRVVTPCTSDKACTPLRQLCDTAIGRCVDCLTDAECSAADHCATGVCEPDVCIPGQAACDGNAVVRCAPSGALEPAAPCAARQSCEKVGSTASCSPWLCDPGLAVCQGNVAALCTADGLGIASSTDCAKAGQKCFAGACSDQACAASAQFCEGNVVKLCDATGQSSSSVRTCLATEYCDAPSATCQPQVCTPGSPSCDGSRATACNATGSGYATGGQDCAATGLTCSVGKCRACGAGGGAQSSVRMVEVMVGTPEYVVLENRDACPVDVGGMVLSFATSNPSGLPYTYTLPTHVLAPGAKVFVLDSTAVSQAGDILSDGNIDWQAAYGGTVLLCVGACTTVSNVVDALAFQGGTAPPPLPVTFAPPLTTITTSNEQTQSFQRGAFSGAYPTFLPADWALGDAARPGSNGTSCPVTQPTALTTCLAFGISCPYGAVTCTCSLTTLYWSCL